MNTDSVRSHWFFLVAPIVLMVDTSVSLSNRGSIDRLIEAGLLFDLVVLVPSLYWLCYRRKGRFALVRAAALACLGVWLALKLVPEAERELVAYVAPLRYVGLAALLLLEVTVVLAIYRSVFKGDTVEQAARQAPAEMPPWVARLLAIEARLWRGLWQRLTRLFRR
jgi:hypothetical protein